MDIMSLISQYSGQGLTTVIILVGILYNWKLLTSLMSKYLAETENKFSQQLHRQDLVDNQLKNSLDNIEKTIKSFQESTEKIQNSQKDCQNRNENRFNNIENNLEKYKQEESEIKKDIHKTLGMIQVSVTQMNNSINELFYRTSKIESHDEFMLQVWENIQHSVDVLGSEDKFIAMQYLRVVYKHIDEITKYINSVEVTGIDRLTFDGLMAQSINSCKKYAYSLGLDRDLIDSYFSSKNLCVYGYKKELFKLLDTEDFLNNTENQYKTLTIRWIQKLCNEFIRHFFVKRS